MNRTSGKILTLSSLVPLLILSIFISISIGPAGIGLSVDPRILNFRLCRTFLASIVGASLATAGCAMQSLFRNPLADPYIIGVSSGASVGAALAILLGLGSMG